MLQGIRGKAQSWFSIVIIGLVILTFALWGVHNYITQDRNEVVAKVNGETITQERVDKAYDRVRQQQLMQLGADAALSSEKEKELKQEILDDLIHNQVMQDAAKKQGYTISEEQVQANLAAIPAFQVNGEFSQERFQQVMANIHMVPQQFLEEMRTALQLEQVRIGAIESAFALPHEIRQATRLLTQKRNFNYAVIPQGLFRDRVKVTPEEIEDYYAGHPSQYTEAARVKLDYVELDLYDVFENTQVQDEDVEQYYHDNLTTFTEPSRWHIAHILIALPEGATSEDKKALVAKAKEVLERAKKGESFEKLAKEYSADTISARIGGELGWMHAGNMAESLALNLNGITKPTVLDEPMRTKQGWEIIKVLGYSKEKIAPLASVKPQIQETLRREQAEQLFFDKREELANLSFSNSGSLSIPASALHLEVKHTGWISQQSDDSAKDDLMQSPVILEQAFSEEVFKNGNNSAVIELSPEKVVVIRVKDKQAAKRHPLSKVAPQIKAELVREKSRQKALELGERMVDQVNHGQLFTVLAQQNHLLIHKKEAVSREQKDIDAQILEVAFALPHGSEAKQKLGGVQLASGDYALVQLTGVNELQMKEISEQEKAYIADILAKGLGQIDYAQYVKSTMGNASIKVTQ